MTNKPKFLVIVAFAIIFCMFYFLQSKPKLNLVKNDYDKYLGSKKYNYKALDDLFKELFDRSIEQSLIEPYVLLKTLQYWMMDVDQYDKKLIEFIKTLIHVPSTKMLNLTEKNKVDYSQHGQSLYMDNLLNKTKNGFFIEAGAFDGEKFSNSLYFEQQRNWNGLLIEPVPSQFQLLKERNRHAYLINACIAKNKPYIARFRVLHVISGIEREMSDNHKDRVKQESLVNNKETYKIAYIPCFPLYSILKAIDVKKVDYFSLDVEGGELNVIQSIPFDEIDIKSFTIEWPGNADNRNKILEIMKKNDFQLLKDDGQDLYLIKNKQM